MLNRWISWTNRSSLWGKTIVLLALLLGGLLLPNPPVADDYYHRVFFTGSQALAELGVSASKTEHSLGYSLNEMFRFFAPQNTNKEGLQALGYFPWWADSELKVAFWRPLTALTHWVDYTFWPNHVSLMRLQSVLWYGLLAGLVWVLFRRITRRRSIAVVGSLIFVIDTTHLETINWIAARNGLLALILSLIAVIALDEYRRQKRRLWSYASYAAFLGALLAGEAGVASFIMVIGYGVCCEQLRSWRAWLTYLPYLLILLVWFACYQWLGYGVDGSGFYLDPLTQSTDLLSHWLIRLPLLAATSISGGGSLLNLVPARILPWLAVGMAVFLAGLWQITRFRFRTHPGLSWGWFVMLAAALPVSAATVFSPRLFLFISVGSALVLAHLLVWVTDRLENGVNGVDGVVMRLWQGYLVGVHLIGSALVWLLIGCVALSTLILPAKSDPLTPVFHQMAGRRVVVIHSPHSFAMLYLPFMIDQSGEPPPLAFNLLFPGYQSFELTRTDTHTLELSRPTGLFMPPSEKGEKDVVVPFGMAGLVRSERFFRAPERPIYAGETMERAHLRVTVLDAEPHRNLIQRIRFESSAPEGFDNILWYVWDAIAEEYQTVEPLVVGETRKYAGYINAGME